MKWMAPHSTRHFYWLQRVGEVDGDIIGSIYRKAATSKKYPLYITINTAKIYMREQTSVYRRQSKKYWSGLKLQRTRISRRPSLYTALRLNTRKYEKKSLVFVYTRSVKRARIEIKITSDRSS